MNAEKRRLAEDKRGLKPWKKWGPYLSERQWGTVREDYSAAGNAWAYLPHDHARSRAYRWGEDGIAGFSDDHANICFCIAMWNGHDPLLKERLFGLTNPQGNHGEDVKEAYYYLDATPTHSYLRMLYKYPHAAFPYDEIIRENARRSKLEREYEIEDTGVFDDGRYFDVVTEYAKSDAEDILMRVTATNRGPEAATLDLLPQVWFRNTWSWTPLAPMPELHATSDRTMSLSHPELGTFYIAADGEPELIVCDNETNARRLFHKPGPQYPRDAFHDYVVNGDTQVINPARVGTKAAFRYRMNLAPGESRAVRLRLTRTPEADVGDFDIVFANRIAEADAFYADVQADMDCDDAKNVQRQAFAGLIWTKQYYGFDVPLWLHGDVTQPPPPRERLSIRNQDWKHVHSAEILSMPDAWEYPWFAAWDSAFHTVPFALIDADFAKQQLLLLTREWYMHPNGQLPAYEWNFGDVNPPVHAWAAWRVFQIDRKRTGGKGDIGFLERILHKLLINFTWWVNRKDPEGHNVFQGGFLGLDNIGVFDRSKPLPTGGTIQQADGTAWMAMYALDLMRIALELSLHNPAYQDIAIKFFEHFLSIASAMFHVGGEESSVGLWDDVDKFYYDQLCLPGGKYIPLKVRSMVGLIPLFAVEVIEPELLRFLPEFRERMEWYLHHRPDLAVLVSRWEEHGRGERRLLSLLRGHRMKKLLRRMLDETEFLSPYGIRSMSKSHKEQPYVFRCEGMEFTVAYVAGESDSGMFGGNSNWRGPVWFPVNFLLIESLQKFHHYYGDDFLVECPTGSGNMMTLEQVTIELSTRLTKLFLLDADNQRPFAAGDPRQADPQFRDYVLFHEYFDGDTGRGLGASHQTGWTALVAKLLHPRARDIGDGKTCKINSLSDLLLPVPPAKRSPPSPG